MLAPTLHKHHMQPVLTHRLAEGYASSASAKSGVGFGDPSISRRTSAHRDTGAFFMPVHRVYGGCAWEPFGAAGFLECRFANLRTVTSNRCLATAGGGSSTLGASPMALARLLPIRSPSARADAHRAMARAALFSDSSARVRMRRYNEHMERARAFDAAAGKGGVA